MSHVATILLEGEDTQVFEGNECFFYYRKDKRIYLPYNPRHINHNDRINRRQQLSVGVEMSLQGKAEKVLTTPFTELVKVIPEEDA